MAHLHPFEVRRGTVTINTEWTAGNLDSACALLETTAWGKSRPRALMRKALEHSLCFAMLDEAELVGFARVITDCGTFAYMADVVIRADHRGNGLGGWLVETMLAHPSLIGMRRWLLVTQNAHSLYERFGFAAPQHPGEIMERLQPYPACT